MEINKYSHRFLARIVLEAETPIAVGSGESGLMTDSLVVTDINGLPYIPSSSIAGVFRHSISDLQGVKSLMGYQEGSKGLGSRLIVSDAIMIGKEGKVLDGVQSIDFEDEFYEKFKVLPIRQHVKISHLGTADVENKGKFDCQVVYKGTRFVFEIEIVATEAEKDSTFEGLLKHFLHKEFRLGSGTHNGYGKVKVVDIQTAYLNLNENGLKQYLSKSSDLSEIWGCYKPLPLENDEEKDWVEYEINISSKDFFLFGSGLSDDEADMTPVEEQYIEWVNEKPIFREGTLIPGSSIKGALAHRTAFYWNEINHLFADKGEGFVGDKNDAVVAIFGSADNDNEKNSIRGKMIINDIILPKKQTKIINHVSIDRFTGGALDEALFTEKATYAPQEQIHLSIAVESNAFEGDESIREAFESALNDLKKGLLPLGGGVNRGNGLFTE